MRPDDVHQWLAANRWANHSMLEVLGRLDDGQLRRPLGSSFPSIHATVVHMLSSEWLWAERFEGRSPRRRLDPADFTDLAAIGALWAEVEARHQVFAAALTAERLDQPFAYRNPAGERWEYRLWQVLYQLVSHSTYHRGQVTTMLRQLGGRPEETDVLTWYDAGAPPAEPAARD